MDDQVKELVVEGEKCIREGELDRGINLLHEALNLYKSEKVEDENHAVESVIYSQLGNGYYMRKDFGKASEFHGKDCEVSVKNGPIHKAKALSNYSMALAMNKQFEEAMNAARQVICEAHSMDSKEAQSFNCRGYYNLGMAYLQAYYDSKDGEEFDTTCFDHLDEAKNAFLKCLEFSKSDNGRTDPVGNLFYNLAVGNLGLVYYFSQDYQDAMSYYEKRLKTAIDSGDHAAQLRTLTNMGNACLQLGKSTDAVTYYYEALENLQTQPNPDPATEARLYFNIANTEFLLKNYDIAIDCFVEACRRAQQVNDTATISESFHQVAVLFEKMQLVPEALYCLIQRFNLEEKRAKIVAQQSLEFSHLPDEGRIRDRRVGTAMESAKRDIADFVRKYPEKCVSPNGRVNVRPVHNINTLDMSSSNNENSPTLTAPVNDENQPIQATHNASTSFELMNSSMESFILGIAQQSSSTTTNRSPSQRSHQYEMLSTTADDDDFSSADVGFSRASNYTPSKLAADSISSLPLEDKTPGPSNDKHPDNEEDFLDFYTRVASRRIDSQRGELAEEPICETDDFKNDTVTSETSNNPEEIIDLIVCIQGRRMEDQRASLILPEIDAPVTSKKKQNGAVGGQEIEDHDQLYNLIMSRQADRLDDQRSELGGRPRSCSALPMELPDDVTDLVIAMQAGRYESQRAHLKPPCSSDSQLNMGQVDGDNSPKRCVSSAAAVSLNTTSTTSG